MRIIDPQGMTPETKLDRLLREYIARERAVERPMEVRVVWTGPGVGVLLYVYEGSDAEDLRAASLPVAGDLADEVRRLEIGGPLPSDPLTFKPIDPFYPTQKD